MSLLKLVDLAASKYLPPERSRPGGAPWCAPADPAYSGQVRLGYRSLCVAALMSGALLTGASPAAAAPRNDDFAQARTLRVGTTVKGNVNGATRQRGERRHADSLARRSVWY